jgi:hypothetical protein
MMDKVGIRGLLRRDSMTTICPFGCRRLDITLIIPAKCRLLWVEMFMS